VERGGTIERAAVRFASAAAVAALVQRVVAPLGLRVDESRPWVDARLPGGERFHAVLPPLAPDGPVVTIRTFARRRLELRDLIERGALDMATARLLEAMVAAGIAIAVSGATGTGKTTLLIFTEEQQIAVPDRAPSGGTKAWRLARSDRLDRQVVVQPPIIAGGPDPRIEGMGAVVVSGRLPDQPGRAVLAAVLLTRGN
jgi:hypothetical protein